MFFYANLLALLSMLRYVGFWNLFTLILEQMHMKSMFALNLEHFNCKQRVQMR